ncbi:hypothetical protein K1719_009543 [Acacia pycnantha]|nr:hypothetical protein K1719_009543 [Acacia pycnantha]
MQEHESFKFHSSFLEFFLSGENDSRPKVGAAIAENGWTGENASAFPLASPLSRSSTLALLVTLLPPSPTLKMPKAEDFVWKPMPTATPTFLGSILISLLPPRVGPVLINIKKETSGASILKSSYEVFPTDNMEELVVQDATKFVLVYSLSEFVNSFQGQRLAMEEFAKEFGIPVQFYSIWIGSEFLLRTRQFEPKT